MPGQLQRVKSTGEFPTDDVHIGDGGVSCFGRLGNSSSSAMFFIQARHVMDVIHQLVVLPRCCPIRDIVLAVESIRCETDRHLVTAIVALTFYNGDFFFLFGSYRIDTR